MEDLEIKRSGLASGLEFLGLAMLGIGDINADNAEKCGCLLLCLAEYAKSLEE